MNTFYGILGERIVLTQPVGSRVTCDPPPMDTDEDHLVLVKEMYDPEFLISHGFKQDVGDENYEGEGKDTLFASFRKDNINLIITANIDFYHKFVAATKMATDLNLLDKKSRIALFQAILYGK